MERTLIRVDQSQLATWRKCQVAEFFRYGYNDRGIEPRQGTGPKNPFVFGSIGHYGLEVYYHPKTFLDKQVALNALQGKWEQYLEKDPFKDKNRTEWATLLAQIIRAMERYFNFFSEWDEDFEPLQPEIPFEIDLTPNNPKYQVLFYGKIDNGVKRKSTGKICFMEFKFYAQMDENPIYLAWDPQVSDYSLVGSSLFGEDYQHMVYRITRKIESPTLINFIQKNLKRTPAKLKTAAKLIVVQALQMERLRRLGPTFLVPLLDTNPIKGVNECMKCPYQIDVCNALIDGEDWETIIGLNYQPRTLYAEHEEKNLDPYEQQLIDMGMAF